MSQIQYFLGGNTPSGFYSLYHELSQPEHMQALYILKGGAGCGKSSLMKRVGRHAQAAGLAAVEILCSGDPESLDALILPQLATAIVDGTAPHVVEPKCPGVVERYVDLSQFYSWVGLQAVKGDILAATHAYQSHYKQVYRCLGAAGTLRQDVYESLSPPDLQQKLAKRAKGIIARELKRGGQGGQLSQRFLSAVTHQGYLTLWDTVRAQASRVYELQDRYGLAHHLLSPILTAALAAGHDAVACPDPMAPDRLAHLILPGLSLAFVTSFPGHAWPHHSYRRLRLDAAAEDASPHLNRPRLRFTRKIAAALEEEAFSALSLAKSAHDELETLYNPHVNFSGVYDTADNLAREILALPHIPDNPARSCVEG